MKLFLKYLLILSFFFFGPPVFSQNFNSDDPYDVLGVTRDMSLEAIKKAFQLARSKTHPDHHPEMDRSVIQKVLAAYETILEERNPKSFNDTAVLPDHLQKFVRDYELTLVQIFSPQMLEEYHIKLAAIKAVIKKRDVNGLLIQIKQPGFDPIQLQKMTVIYLSRLKMNPAIRQFIIQLLDARPGLAMDMINIFFEKKSPADEMEISKKIFYTQTDLGHVSHFLNRRWNRDSFYREMSFFREATNLHPDLLCSSIYFALTKWSDNHELKDLLKITLDRCRGMITSTLLFSGLLDANPSVLKDKKILEMILGQIQLKDVAPSVLFSILYFQGPEIGHKIINALLVNVLRPLGLAIEHAEMGDEGAANNASAREKLKNAINSFVANIARISEHKLTSHYIPSRRAEEDQGLLSLVEISAVAARDLRSEYSDTTARDHAKFVYGLFYEYLTKTQRKKLFTKKLAPVPNFKCGDFLTP